MKVMFLLVLSFFMSASFCQAAADMDKLQKKQWLRIKTINFDILTDLDLKKAKILISDLEAYHYFHTGVLKMELDSQAEAFVMLAIGSPSSFKSLGAPWDGVFRFGKDSVAVANVAKYSDNLNKPSYGRHVLLHEYQHYLSRFYLKKISFPLWFEEGKAEYYATFKYDGKNIYIGNPKAIISRAYWLFSSKGTMEINSRNVLTTKSLPLRSTRTADTEIVQEFYARSFFIVHYLYSNFELRESMTKYFNQVKSGVSEENAMKHAFNQTFEEFDKRVVDYLKNNLSMRVFSVKDGNFSFPEVKPEIKVLTEDDARGRLTHFVRTLGLE
jgi:hypothetical protein